MKPQQRHLSARRSSPRLKHYDYATPGSYFFTIRTDAGAFLFGEVVDGLMQSNALDEEVVQCWNRLSSHYPLVELDAFVVMPNHVHGIVFLNRKSLFEPPDYSLSEIIRVLKSFSTRRINALRQTPGGIVWQRSFYDHIIRDDRDLERVRGYIEANPGNWQYDSDNPASDRSRHLRPAGRGPV